MSSGFITETEIAEAKKRRQEEWDKVRTADQPEEAPEETYDPRPLYQRLEEQRNKKDADYEEAHKLKNMIRGLDDDEVGFLELVEQNKASVARQISLEEQREMREFRERVSTVQDSAERERLHQISGVPQNTPKKPLVNNTRNKLQGVIVKKRKASDSDSSKSEEPPIKNGSMSNGTAEYAKKNGHGAEKSDGAPRQEEPAPCDAVAPPPPVVVSGGMRCVGVLPGIGPYGDSSDSDCSSDSDDGQHTHPHYDLLGRKQECKEQKTEEKS